MANTNFLDGMKCPRCNSEGPFKIAVCIMAMVHDSGVDEHVGNYEWDDNATCICCNCDLIETVEDFNDEN